MKKEYILLALAAILVYRILKNRNQAPKSETTLVEEVNPLEVAITPATDQNLAAKTELAKMKSGMIKTESFEKLPRSKKHIIKPPLKIARA